MHYIMNGNSSNMCIVPNNATASKPYDVLQQHKTTQHSIA